MDLVGGHRRLDHRYPQREAFLAGPEYQCGGPGANIAAKLTIFSDYTLVVRQKANEACMARWSSECRLFAVASVALSCSACDAHAFALCEYCPDLFASTPIAYQAALPRRRVQSTSLHDRYASRWHQKRDDPLPPWLVFGAETVGSTASQPMDEGASSATTPAVRIDEFFNLMSVGESDQPEQVVALRASTGFVLPVLIAFGSSLLIGAALIAGVILLLPRLLRERRAPKTEAVETGG
jgi:hypothetical protein